MSVRFIDLDAADFSQADLDRLAELLAASIQMHRDAMLRQYLRMKPAETPERAAALKRCRSLKRLRDDAAATEGERTNAQAAMDRIMAKHGIAAGEL